MGKLEKYLSLFDLDHNYNENDLKSAYRTLSKVWHPDRFESNRKLRDKAEEKFKEINNGYQFLKEHLEFNSSYESSQGDSYTDNKDPKTSQSRQNYKKQKYNYENEKKENSHGKTYNSDSASTTKNFNWMPILIFLGIAIFFVIINNIDTNTTYNTVQTDRQKHNNEQQTVKNNSNLNSTPTNSRTPTYAGQKYYETALELEESQDFQNALNYLNRAIELSPEFAKAYEARGDLKYVLRQDWYGALNDHQKAIELDPDFKEAYVSSAFMKMELGYDIDSICEDINRAKELGSNAPLVHWERCE